MSDDMSDNEKVLWGIIVFMFLGLVVLGFVLIQSIERVKFNTYRIHQIEERIQWEPLEEKEAPR